MDLRAVLAEMRQELAGVEQTAETLRAGIAAMEIMVERRQAEAERPITDSVSPSRNGDDAAANMDPNAPRGASAVEMILLDYPRGQWVDLADLVQEFADRGWGPDSSNPREAVRANAYRLVSAKEHEFEGGRGRYRRRPSTEQLQSMRSTGEGGEGDRGSVGGGQGSVMTE